MDTLRIQIHPLTAFGGAIKGDTLFGQICWAVVHRHGEERLQQLLQGYTGGEPFLVSSDAFPHGYLPRSAMPLHGYSKVADQNLKQIKKRLWLPLEKASEPLCEWLEHSLSEQQLLAYLPDSTTNNTPDKKQTLSISHPQPHNTIHRGMNTTYGGEFAPYTMSQLWFAPGLRLDLWVKFDAARITAVEVEELLGDIGHTGFGRDAGIGLGKFEIDSVTPDKLPNHDNANACMTLAPCAPQGLGLDAQRCYYAPFTRFGRHGDRAVLSGRPFKNPLLLANTGAILSGLQAHQAGYAGQGLGGKGRLSNAIEETVHQGYAPCIGVHLQELKP